MVLIAGELILSMTLVEVAGGFVAGVIVGIGASLFYLRWKVKRQLGMMQGQMEEMMDLTAGMGDLEEELPDDLEDEVPEDLGDEAPDLEEKED